MFCDLETGICGVPGEEDMGFFEFTPPKKSIDLYYVTDPICSHCWALEPVLRRFKEQYGHYFNFHTLMGGLLEKWDDTPVDPTNGIHGPKDVFGHWRDVGVYTRMPIDGSLWFNNPIQSSFPPSRVYKIIQATYNDELANKFLRRAREAVFAFNHNIADKQVMVELVNQIGLHGESIVNEAASMRGQQLLNDDFRQAQNLSFRVFPTIIMVNKDNKGVKIVGSRPLEYYVEGLKKLLNDEELKPIPQPPFAQLLAKEERLFSKEIEIMYDLERDEVPTFIGEQLIPDTYELKEILNEKYVVKK